jgi:hypothetical protein
VFQNQKQESHLPVDDWLNNIVQPFCRFATAKEEVGRTHGQRSEVSTFYSGPGNTVIVSHISSTWEDHNHREWNLCFRRTPTELLADNASGRVRAARLEVNKLEVSHAIVQTETTKCLGSSVWTCLTTPGSKRCAPKGASLSPPLFIKGRQSPPILLQLTTCWKLHAV